MKSSVEIHGYHLNCRNFLEMLEIPFLHQIVVNTSFDPILLDSDYDTYAVVLNNQDVTKLGERVLVAEQHLQPPYTYF